MCEGGGHLDAKDVSWREDKRGEGGAVCCDGHRDVVARRDRHGARRAGKVFGESDIYRTE